MISIITFNYILDMFIKTLFKLSIGIFGFFMLPLITFAQTEIKENIIQDTHWTIANSPYIINPLEQDFFVNENATLTIDPGVVIKVANNRSFYVEGKLIAQGRANQHIIFTSIYDLSENSIDQAHSGDWYGIKLSGDNSHLEYVDIKFAGKKNYHNFKDAALVIIGHNHVIHHNFISGSDSDGIHLYVAFASVRYNLIESSDGNGISTNEGKSEISYNIIQKNEEHGLSINSYANIRGNIILLNQKDGIHVGENSNNPDIRSNHIDLNGNAGIALKRAISSLKGNALTGNRVGIQIDNAVGQIEIEDNDFIGNKIGMEIKNVIPSNDLYRLINAEHNYWGHPDGPHDPSKDRKNKDYLYNINRKGDPISDFINYVPWSKTPHTRFLKSTDINTKAPEIPINVWGKFEQTKIIISWLNEHQNDIVGYNIFKSDQELENYKKIGSVNVNYFIDREFERGDTYFYKISAVDYSGNESFLSYGIPVTTDKFEKSTAFIDVKNTDWHAYYITYLQNKGVIQGYSDHTFRPNNYINRAELVKMVLIAKGITAQNGHIQKFTDVKPYQWYTDFINTAFDLGIINGYNKNYFHPEKMITRAEALKVILKAYDYQDYHETDQQFSDVPVSAWYHPYTSYAVSRGIIEQKPNFKPNDLISRAEVAKLITMMDK